jgi:Ca2+-transporting ATPase
LSGICGAAAHGIRGLTQGISIIVAGLIMMLIMTYADLIKDKRFVSLQSIIREGVIPVIRGKFGATSSKSIWELVVGDVIHLSSGDRIPADCLVLESSDLQVEEK